MTFSQANVYVTTITRGGFARLPAPKICLDPSVEVGATAEMMVTVIPFQVCSKKLTINCDFLNVYVCASIYLL